MFGWSKARLIGYGFILGTAGVKILSSSDAKRVYTHVTAAVMRGVDETVRIVQNVRENCEDIASEAKAMNEQRAAEERQRQIEDAKALLSEGQA